MNLDALIFDYKNNALHYFFWAREFRAMGDANGYASYLQRAKNYMRDMKRLQAVAA